MRDSHTNLDSGSERDDTTDYAITWEVEQARAQDGYPDPDPFAIALQSLQPNPDVRDLDLPIDTYGVAERVEHYLPHTLRWVADREAWALRTHPVGNPPAFTDQQAPPSQDGDSPDLPPLTWRLIDEKQAMSAIIPTLRQIERAEAPYLRQQGRDDDAKELTRLTNAARNHPSTTKGVLSYMAGLPVHRVEHLDNTTIKVDQLATNDGYVIDLRQTGARRADPRTVHLGGAGATLGGLVYSHGCPVWLQFLMHTQPDPAMRDYLQRVAGYSFTAETRERAVFFHSGPSGTGKSTFLETLLAAAGSYGRTPGRNVFTKKAAGAASTHNSALISLAGGRFIALDETNDGGQLDEALMKGFSSGSQQTERMPYGRGEVSFRPVGKIHIGTNSLPNIKTLAGMDTRVHSIHWSTPLQSASPRLGDGGDLKLYLAENELDGIMAWVVEGARRYYREGLRAPQQVIRDTQEYLQDQDELGRFFEDCIARATPDAFLTNADLYPAYRLWCEVNGLRPLSSIALSRKLVADMNCERGTKQIQGKVHRGWQGIALSAATVEARVSY